MTDPLIGVTTVLSLLIALPLVHAQAVATPTGCPASVGIENGNFDSGQFAPWATPSRSPVSPTISIVSSGYNSALQLEFPAANLTSWFFLQDIALQCEGAQYFTSFAVNWLNFSIHGDPDTNWCNLDVGSSYCFDLGVYNATDAPGWQYHSFICTAQKSGYATLVIDIGCEATYDIPAFTWQLTDFDIHLVGTSISSQSTPSQSTPTTPPTPPPSQSSSAPSSFSNFTSSAITTPSTTLSATTSPTNILTSSMTIPTSSMSLTNIATSSTNVLTSSITISTSLTSPSILSAANKACQARETGFLLGPMGLVLLIPYVVY